MLVPKLPKAANAQTAQYCRNLIGTPLGLWLIIPKQGKWIFDFILAGDKKQQIITQPKEMMQLFTGDF
jgi:hypothetical protein